MFLFKRIRLAQREREWGGDEYGMLRQAQHNAYPPALPKWKGGWARDGCDDCPFREAGLMRDEIVDFPCQSNFCLRTH